MKNIDGLSREQIKNQLQRGDYKIISDLTKGLYTPETVKHMILGNRTLKKPVIDASNKLFKFRKDLLTSEI